MTREEALKKMQAVRAYMVAGNPIWNITTMGEAFDKAIEALLKEPEWQWIPVSEGLPDDLAEVNVTFVNTDPEPYYEEIKDVPFTGSAVYHKGKWYWYSSTCVDLLEEYDTSPYDRMDDGIKVIAWMPLPKPYKDN